MDISCTIIARKMQHLSSSFIHISECLESANMLIDRALTNIATSRIRDLEATKSLEKCWEEKYSNSDFFHEISIKMFHAHTSGIESEGIFNKCHNYIQRSDNIEKCHHIADTGNIVECILFKKKPTSDERESRIL